MFFLGNSLLFWLIGLKFITALFPGEFFMCSPWGKVLVGLFIIFSYLLYLALLAFLPAITIFILILLFPSRKFIFLVSICLATAAAFLLMIDAIAYTIYRFHLGGIILQLILHGSIEQVFSLTTNEILFGLFILCGLLGIEYFYAYQLWRNSPSFKFWGTRAAIFLIICFYLSLALPGLNMQNTTGKVLLDTSRFLPGYSSVLEKFLFSDLTTFRHFNETRFVQPPQANIPLNYPIEKNLQCASEKKPKNILIIVIDTWRFDMLNSQVMPTLSRFAKQSWTFTQHYSGGDATAPGIFSLFYSIPAVYWTAMEMQHRGPVFIDELLKQHYQTGIFASASLKWPAFHKTVFQAINALQLVTPGQTAYERDKAITQSFEKFIMQQKNSAYPFFSFLFYDSAHAYCEFNDVLDPFHPAIKTCKRFILTNQSDPIPYLNRYKNALHLVDQQIKYVIDTLQAKKMLNDTIIVITGDHGEEFNDNHLGYWGHTSNFLRYQVQTPLIVYSPGNAPQVFTHKTSHFDIVPTLMTQVLGCRAELSSYSVGKNLLDKSSRSYLIIGSYVDYGIVEPDRITTVFPFGNYGITDLNGKEIVDAKLDIDIMRKAFIDMRKFYLISKANG